MNYQVIAPPPSLKRFVRYFWTLESQTDVSQKTFTVMSNGERSKLNTGDETLALAYEAGFKEAKTTSAKDMEQLYFANRTDHLLPASGEIFLLATT